MKEINIPKVLADEVFDVLIKNLVIYIRKVSIVNAENGIWTPETVDIMKLVVSFAHAIFPDKTPEEVDEYVMDELVAKLSSTETSSNIRIS